MSFFRQFKAWFGKNRRIILIGGTVCFIIFGTSVGYVLYNSRKMPLSDWLKVASKEELDKAYEELQLIFCKTGKKPYGMEQISCELGERGAKEWFEKHPPNTDPNFRWTDANRWDKD